MINIGPTTRKNSVGSLWQVIGDIWEKVKINEDSRKYVEGMWTGNSILADERLNILLNTYDRLVQRYYQAYKGVMRLDNFSTKVIKRQRLDGFNIEYKYFFNELEKNVRYIYSPKFLTNDYRSPDLIEELFTCVIHRIYPKQNKIVLLVDSLSGEIQEGLKGCFFLDSKNNQFVIEKMNHNELIYKKVFKDTVPFEGEMKIYKKFELENNVDYKIEIEEDFMIFRFKDYKYINEDSDLVSFFDQSDTHLYGFDIPYIDRYCEINFGYPVGLTDEDFTSLRKSGFTWPEINQMILDIWKIDQRVYGFDQIYRYAAIFSGNEISRGIREPLYLYSNDVEKEFVLLSKSKNIVDSDVITGGMIPDYIRISNKITVLDKTNFLKIKSFVLNDIFLNDPIILDKETYYVKKNIDNVYLELDREVVGHPSSNIINILDKDRIKLYDLNNYGKYELNDYNLLLNGEMSNLSDILDVTGTISWGERPWGSFNFGNLYYQQIHPQCRFKPLDIGREFLFGDCFQPYILPNFYYSYDPDTAGTESQKYLTGEQYSSPIIIKDPNKEVPYYFIQKQLALDNKEFTENNFKQYRLNKTLLLLPFFNYSEKLDIAEINLFRRSGWGSDGTVETNYLYNDFYGYTNVKSTAASEDDYCNIYHEIDPFTNNKTGKSILRLFLRVNKGKIKVGVSGDIFLENSNTKFIFQEQKKNNEDLSEWEYVNIFIDNNLLTQNARYNIVIESFGSSDYDIFGVQFYKNIPDYFERLFKNRKVLEKFVSSNNYKLINLL